MKKLRSAILVLVALAVLIAGQSVAMANQPKKDFIAGPDKTEFLKVLSATATLELANRSILSFVEMPDAKGRTEAIAIVEEIAPGQDSYRSLERLERANPLEVFNALSPRGTEFPEMLMKLYGRPSMGPQGWAMGELSYNEPGTGYTPPCPSWGVAAFNDALDYGMNNFSDNFKSTWDGPTAKPNHWHLPANGGLGNGIATRDLYGQAFNVTAFSTAVVLCHTDEYNYVGGVYAGNFVNVKYKISDLPWWFVFEAGQLDDIGKVVSAQFHPAGYGHHNATEYDLRLEILNAEMNDLFHIGATWHEKVGDLTLGQ